MESHSGPSSKSRRMLLSFNRPVKKAHLRRCARPARSNVLLQYASARWLFARLASGTFLTGLRTGFFNTLLSSRMEAE